MKTGYTNASGYNLAASAVRDGRRLITVVLGGRSTASRNAHVAELMDTGFEVERRRAQGERIQVAQTFFEQRGFGVGSAIADAPIAYASVNDDEDGVGAESTAVAYTAAPAPAALPTRVAPAPSERAASQRAAAACKPRVKRQTAKRPWGSDKARVATPAWSLNLSCKAVVKGH